MIKPMAGGRRRIDQVLDPGFVAGLDALDGPTVRQRRQTAMQEEADLSYLRRMLQGRLDVLTRTLADLSRSGAARAEQIAAAVADSSHTSDPLRSRHLTHEPTRVGEGRRGEERVLASAGLIDVDRANEEQLASVIAELQAEERRVSEVRHQVHDVIDALTAEMTLRYQRGELDPLDALRRGE